MPDDFHMFSSPHFPTYLHYYPYSPFPFCFYEWTAHACSQVLSLGIRPSLFSTIQGHCSRYPPLFDHHFFLLYGIIPISTQTGFFCITHTQNLFTRCPLQVPCHISFLLYRKKSVAVLSILFSGFSCPISL